MWRRGGFSCKRGIRRLSTAVRCNVVEDEGYWSYASEWWGADGADGADGGHAVFRSSSDHSDGIVSVVAYPCSKLAPEQWPTVENWLQQRYAKLHPYNSNTMSSLRYLVINGVCVALTTTLVKVLSN